MRTFRERILILALVHLAFPDGNQCAVGETENRETRAKGGEMRTIDPWLSDQKDEHASGH